MVCGTWVCAGPVFNFYTRISGFCGSVDNASICFVVSSLPVGIIMDMDWLAPEINIFFISLTSLNTGIVRLYFPIMKE